VGSNSYRQIAADLRSIDQLDLMVANSCSQRACTFSVFPRPAKGLGAKELGTNFYKISLAF
jgi:hypothetical protein